MLLCRIAVFLGLLPLIQCHPINWLHKLSSQTERSGLWRWIWDADHTVSVLERSPPIVFFAKPALFGAELEQPLQGYVIPLSSFTGICPDDNSTISLPRDYDDEDPLPLNDGCPRRCASGPNVPDPADTWIALVQRGECDFVSKAREAQRLGAKAVVVGGDDPRQSGNRDVPITMLAKEDASDVTIAATFIRFSDYSQLFSFIRHSNTTHNGLRTVSLSISAESLESAWYSPALTFVTILMLPSLMTVITLIIHRIRAARQAQLDRAPEDIVRNLPWQVWTGSGWEKHAGPVPKLDESGVADVTDANDELERAVEAYNEQPASASHGAGMLPQEQAQLPWFEQQHECAICLCEFVKGDRVRVLPCHHIFHLDEVDDWLINRKKLCPVCKADVTQPAGSQQAVAHDDHEDSSAQRESQTPPAPTERTPLLASHRSPSGGDITEPATATGPRS
ncbi:hypothetical protein PUNSTDRAFT_61229 [Punctularia strigosozonata HHB-11173 SS5]|uniref:uncharacterized protein n=1 Tax=Punctularia strigosozonata (strain HHB-11173) TaxID=741275 RepID=UPI000441642C|nr:uncharacterized protein PUNSTDRAFT_61229 [Punctularia strigosozonata HHB-11173 SS5]EIN12856.1 hypothetical protein PUNSTDRAFT_61229 [Punctularia strigosozonata HHB-11173 SS5]